MFLNHPNPAANGQKVSFILFAGGGWLHRPSDAPYVQMWRVTFPSGYTNVKTIFLLANLSTVVLYFWPHYVWGWASQLSVSAQRPANARLSNEPLTANYEPWLHSYNYPAK
jgi:hypothetical protein